MKVIRGKSFEVETGAWEKIEVELSSDDLLLEEELVSPHLRPLLLETRAEQQLVSFSQRLGLISEEEAQEEAVRLASTRQKIFDLDKKQKSKKAIRSRLVSE